MDAKEYFQIHYGGNHNVSTLTSLAIIEFAEAYHKVKLREQTSPLDALIEIAEKLDSEEMKTNSKEYELWEIANSAIKHANDDTKSI